MLPELPFLLAHTHIKRNDIDSRQQKSPFILLSYHLFLLVQYPEQAIFCNF